MNTNQTIEEEPMPLIENVKIIKVIGEGSFGQVLLGEWNGTKIAMKKLVDINDDAILEFEQEAKLLWYFYFIFKFIIILTYDLF